MQSKSIKAGIFIICFFVFLRFSSLNLYSQEIKVQVIKKDAVLRVHPNNDSPVILTLPLGGMLNAIETIGDWIKVLLPPDEKEYKIIGYVHNSFVRFSIDSDVSEPVEPVVSKPSELDVGKDSYSSWNRELAKAKSKRSTGLILSVSGGVIFTTCMILTFAHQRTEYESLTFYSIAWEKKARTGYLIGDGIGLTALVVGLAIYLPAQGQVKQSEAEGQRKGYIKAGLLPKYKAVGIQIGISF